MSPGEAIGSTLVFIYGPYKIEVWKGPRGLVEANHVGVIVEI